MSTTVGLGVAITLADMFTPKLKNAEKGVGRFTAKLAALSTASVAIGQKMNASFASAYKTFGETAVKQGDLMSLGIDTKGMEAITDVGLKFANKWSGTILKDFVGASYDIKSGISSLSDVAVGSMTSIAALTGKATKSSTGQMTSLFATGYGIYRNQFDAFGSSVIKGWSTLSDEEKDIKFGEYFSAGIASSVQAFKTDGGQMSSAISTLGASATSAKIKFAEQLSVLGMLQSTMSGSEAGTKYKSFLNTIAKSGKDLKLNFMDSNKQLLSMPQIIRKLKEKYGKTLDEMEKLQLKKALGTDEAMAQVLLFWDKVEELEANIQKTDLSLKGGLKLTTEMAEAREYGQESKLLGEQLQNLAYIFGKALAPSMKWVTTKFSTLVGWVQDFVGEHKKLASTVATGLVVFAGLATTLGTLGVAVAGISFGLSTLGLSMSGVLLVGAPMLALVGGLAYAGYAIYKGWGKITKVMKPLFLGLSLGLKNAATHWNRLLSYVTPTGAVFEGIVSKGKSLLSFFSGLFTLSKEGSKSFYGMMASGAQLVMKISSVFGGMVDIVGASMRLIKFSLGGYVKFFRWAWMDIQKMTLFDPGGALSTIWDNVTWIFRTTLEGWGKLFDLGMAVVKNAVTIDPSASIAQIWEPVVNIFNNAVKGWKKVLQAFWDWVIGLFNDVMDKFDSMASAAKEFMTGTGVGGDARLKDSRSDRVGPAFTQNPMNNSLASQLANMPKSPGVNHTNQKTVNVKEGDTHIVVNVHGKNDDAIVRDVTRAIKHEIQDKSDRSYR